MPRNSNFIFFALATIQNIRVEWLVWNELMQSPSDNLHITSLSFRSCFPFSSFVVQIVWLCVRIFIIVYFLRFSVARKFLCCQFMSNEFRLFAPWKFIQFSSSFVFVWMPSNSIFYVTLLLLFVIHFGGGFIEKNKTQKPCHRKFHIFVLCASFIYSFIFFLSKYCRW